MLGGENGYVSGGLNVNVSGGENEYVFGGEKGYVGWRELVCWVESVSTKTLTLVNHVSNYYKFCTLSLLSRMIL